MRRIVNLSLIAVALAAGPALAQPAGTATPPPVPAPPPANPPVTTNPPPTSANPPVVTTPPPEVETPPESPPVNQPVQQAPAPAPEPIELSPTEPYPNGLADPSFDNMAQADNDRGGGGFPWGLLGLLGLLGLVPWLRGGPKTIYVERERPRPGQDPNRPQ
ncbi:MAG TPA: hypothetical protein VEC11_01190 [Allosphingosinicella sp.]|nr:hypothetical protein [Allosphingosinicella sp.]